MRPQQKVLPLTSLRFFAALFVIFYHTAPSVFGGDIPAPIASFINLGFTAVSFFFMLSGYILSVVYLAKDEPLNRRKFWLARIARVYPLFVFTLILDTPFLLLHRISAYGIHSALLKTGATFIANLVMLQAWIMDLRGIDNPNWSLAVESFFYLIFPFIAYFLWKLSRKTTLLLIGVAYIAAIALPFLGMRLHVTLDVLKFDPLLHVAEFVAGILLARWHTGALAVEESLLLLQRWGLCMVVSAMGLFALVVRYQQSIALPVIHDGLLMPAFGLLIIAYASGNESLNRVISMRFLVVLGEASYAMYLVHIPVWHFVIQAHLDQSRSFYPAYLLIVIGVSVASFYWFETPMRRLILRTFDVTPAAPAERRIETLVAQ